MFFPKIYVVAVKSFVDRVASMARQSKSHGLVFDYLWQFDASELTKADIDGIDLPKLASISSARKHLLAEYRLLESGDPYAVVLEDDVILCGDFKLRLSQLMLQLDALEGPWVVNLAGADSHIDSRFVRASNNDLIRRQIGTVEGYVINRSGAQMRLVEFERLGMSLAFDHWLQEIDEVLGIPHYWVAKPMLRQGSVTGEFATGLDESRSRKPAWFLRLRFGVKVFLRRWWPRAWFLIKKFASSNKLNA